MKGNPQTASEWLAYSAALVNLTAFFVYGFYIVKGRVKRPVFASLLIWAVESILALITFEHIANDWLKVAVAFADSLGCVAIFLLSYQRGAFEKPDQLDIVVIVVDMATIVIWSCCKSGDLIVYVIIQAASAISVIPTCRNAWKDPKSEKLLPWVLWTSSFLVSGVVVLMRWNGAADMLYPAVHAAMWFLVTVILVTRTKRNN